MNEKDERGKAIDQFKKGREQQVVDAARMVFRGQEECWLSIGYVNMQLCRYPNRFGLRSMSDVPLPAKFEHLITHCGLFDQDRIKDQVLVRPKKETW